MCVCVRVCVCVCVCVIIIMRYSWTPWIIDNDFSIPKPILTQRSLCLMITLFAAILEMHLNRVNTPPLSLSLSLFRSVSSVYIYIYIYICMYIHSSICAPETFL